MAAPRDLLRELPAPTDALDPVWGRITRIAVDPEHWPVIPRKVPVNGHVVKVGWFTSEIDPHKLLLLSHGSGRWDLLVIPPETGARSAARLLAAASGYDDPPLTASALTAADRAGRAASTADRPLDPDETREYEGGTRVTPPAVSAKAGDVSRLIIGR